MRPCVAWGCDYLGLVLRGLVGWAAMNKTYLSWAIFRVVWVPWSDTRITRNNFGYRGLEPELGFGFFGLGFFGFRLGFFGYGFGVSSILPTHRHADRTGILFTIVVMFGCV